jgi:plasmid stabilization system protein ParE
VKEDNPRKVSYTQRALDDLVEMEAFISRTFSKAVAFDSIEAITDRILMLETAPLVSKKDLTARDVGPDLRYVIVKKARIQFEITDKEIVVLRIQDARQYPGTF